MEPLIQSRYQQLEEEEVKPLERLSFWQIIRIVGLFGITLMGDTQYVNLVTLKKKFVIENNVITEEEFDTFNILAQKSPGIRSNKLIFIVCYYKCGLLAGIVAVFLFNLPNSIVMYLFSQHSELNGYLIVNILLSGFRSAVAAILINTAEVLENNRLQNILAFFSFIVCSFFPTSFIFFIMYLVAVMIGFFSKIQTKHILMTRIKLDIKYSFPALVLIISWLIILWILNRLINNPLLYVAEIISVLVSVTMSRANAFFALLYGQISLFRELSKITVSIQILRQAFINMLGITIVLPGPLTNLTIYEVSYFFGIKGALISSLILTFASIIWILVYIKYGYMILENQNCKRIILSLNCVNKGFYLFMAYQIFHNQVCQFGMAIYITIILLIVLRIYKIHRYVAVIIGALLACSRKFFLWYYRNINDFVCVIN